MTLKHYIVKLYIFIIFSLVIEAELADFFGIKFEILRHIRAMCDIAKFYVIAVMLSCVVQLTQMT